MFDGPCQLFRSPGRINILGEHTDYNEGFVLPGAIDKEAIFAIGLNNLGQFDLVSLDLGQRLQAQSSAPSPQGWANYCLGVVAQIEKRGITVPGFNLVFGSTIPIGAGVSSSAAIECGLLFALNTLLELGLDRTTLASMAQTAEHEYAGVKCGIMDQFAVLHGRAGKIIKLDCRSLEHSYHPLNLTEHALVLCDTGVKHALASSEYNTRREECIAGVNAINTTVSTPPITSLRDADLSLLAKAKASLRQAEFNRCQYVIEENARVASACQAMEENRLEALGELMYATHAGLKELYEVSCPELDQLVDIAAGTDGVVGARMMGGGFGGCTLNIVQQDAVEAFIARTQALYYTPQQKQPSILVTELSDGTSALSL